MSLVLRYSIRSFAEQLLQLGTRLDQPGWARHRLSVCSFQRSVSSFSTSSLPSYSSTLTRHTGFMSNNADDDEEEEFTSLTNEELQDTSTIPGWHLIHSPPLQYPRGALVGTVVSDKMQKTVNVAVDRYRIVPKIRKRLKYTRKFMAHDEKEVAREGDLVMITPCHRLSKRKHFMLREIIRPKGQL